MSPSTKTNIIKYSIVMILVSSFDYMHYAWLKKPTDLENYNVTTIEWLKSLSFVYPIWGIDIGYYLKNGN